MPTPHATNIATLIASDEPLGDHFAHAMDLLSDAGLAPEDGDWIRPEFSKDIDFAGDIDAARAALAPMEAHIDICVQGKATRRKMLLVSDMDSTMITVECIDELADYAGIKPQIAAVTERAMQGELDFSEALRARVALLAGLDEVMIARCLAERVKPMVGAETLVKTMTAWGAHCVLVSGGFVQFADAVAEQIGFHEARANMLGIADNALTGKVVGDIVDAGAKRRLLLARRDTKAADPALVLAVGDGANDIPMIAAAIDGGGIGAAYHAKPKAAKASNFAIRHGDLTALLLAQGIGPQDWD